MTSVNTGYETRLQGILKQGAQKAPSFTRGVGLPTVGFDRSEVTGLFGKIAPYLIYALLITFVVLLILVIVHYTVTPIFNFGENPDALINLTVPDWTKSWEDSSKTYVDSPAGLVVAKNNFSLVMDVNVNNITPTAQIGNVFVLAYKTAGVLPAAQAGVTVPMSEEVENANGEKIKAKLITDFSFLDTPSTPTVMTEPSFVVAYDAVKGLLTVYYMVSTGPTTFIQSVYTAIRPNTSYRVGVVITTTQVELYLNGQFASSKIYPGKTFAGTDNDILVSTPGKFSENGRVANCFLVNRVVSSGEIRAMGGPATMKLD
jgi:hypothetical protein